MSALLADNSRLGGVAHEALMKMKSYESELEQVQAQLAEPQLRTQETR